MDMQSEAAAGRRLERSNLGMRIGGGEDAREDSVDEDVIPSEEP